MKCLPISLSVILLLAIPAYSAELRTSVSALSVTTAETLSVRVDAEWARDEEMPPLPKPYGAVGEFIVRGVIDVPRRLAADGESLTSGVVIELLPPLPGSYELPGFEIGGQPVMVEVRSLLPAETADLKLRAPAEKRGAGLPWWLVLLLLEVACATAFWIWRKRRKSGEAETEEADPISVARMEIEGGADPIEVAGGLEDGGVEVPAGVAELLDHARYSRDPGQVDGELRDALAGWLKEVEAS